MDDIRYKIVGKVYSGVDIVGFVIVNSNGNTMSVKPADAVKLARVGKLRGCNAVLNIDTGEYVLCIDQGYDSIEKTINDDKLMKISCRLIDADGKTCIGYKATDKTGKSYRLSINKTWELASNGLIDGIEAKIINNNKILLSTDKLDLESLPKLYN